MTYIARLLTMLLVGVVCVGCRILIDGEEIQDRFEGLSGRSFACEFWRDLDAQSLAWEAPAATEFLRAECHLSRQEMEKAREAYRNVLCEVAAFRGRPLSSISCNVKNDEVNDQPSSIGGFALWRILLEFPPRSPGSKWAADIFRVADSILHKNGPTRRLFASSAIQYTGTSLSDFATDIWSRLSDLAWAQGMFHRSALYGYLAGVGGNIQHEGDVRAWFEKGGSIEDVWIGKESLLNIYLTTDQFEHLRDYWSGDGRGELMRAKQLEDLRLFRRAVAPLSIALGSTDIDVRLRAHIALSKMGPRIALSSDDRLTVINSGIEDARNNDFARNSAFQEALLERGRVLDAEGEVSGAIRSYDEASNVVTGQDCGTDRTHEAIYLLARRYEQTTIGQLRDNEHHLEAARTQYERLRDWCDGLHSRGESAYFRAALMEYGQGELGSAVALLEGLLLRESCNIWKRTNQALCYPVRGNREDSKIFRAALFWLARIYMEQGKDELSARTVSMLLPDSGPQRHRRFTYYGIRGMMLRSALRGGTSHDGRSSLVYPDPSTNEAIVKQYFSQSNAVSLCDGEKQKVVGGLLRSLCWKFRSGAYAKAKMEVMKAWEEERLVIGRNDPQYILHFMETLGPLAIWRSVRADAISEALLRRDTSIRLAVAREFAKAGDWNMAVTVQARWGLASATPGHLALAFPAGRGKVAAPFVEEIRKVASGDRELAELIYAVMRQESAFAETALSRAGAFGLFQFMRGTFMSPAIKERARSIGGVRRREAFMVSPSRAVELGSFWLDDLRRRHGSLVLAAMEHNAGRGAVERWFYNGERLRVNYTDDVEWLVEMAWRPQTRDFVREILVNLAIIRAAWNDLEEVPFRDGIRGVRGD